tara:strand:- start:89 stop:274 length:186 start_codon:yes stop_codon:yes gene_type:complete
MNMQNREPLSDDEIEQIASRASEIAYARFYQKVGESVVRRGLFILGAGAAAIWFYINGDIS